MFAPGEREFAGNAAAYGASPGSPELYALTSALGRLATAADGATDAVTRHDRLALIRANEVAEALIDEINGLAVSLTPADRAMLGELGVPALCRRLGASARRNAYLIEQAWAVDAALMRLLLGLGRVGSDGTVGGYAAPAGPTCVDRGA
jgi:hypothetical protein